jgi:hypothetical protein
VEDASQHACACRVPKVSPSVFFKVLSLPCPSDPAITLDTNEKKNPFFLKRTPFYNAIFASEAQPVVEKR